MSVMILSRGAARPTYRDFEDEEALIKFSRENPVLLCAIEHA